MSPPRGFFYSAILTTCVHHVIVERANIHFGAYVAHEILPWKEVGCTMRIPTDSLSKRETFSREINEEEGGGGALNANYRTAEALAVVSNVLGNMGLYYGVHFVFKTGGQDEILLDFSGKQSYELAERFLPVHLARLVGYTPKDRS